MKKNIILFVGKVPLSDIKALRKKTKKLYRFGIVHTEHNLDTREQKNYESTFDIVIKINMKSETTIFKSLVPYVDELLAITCRSEAKIHEFAKIIPFVPYLRTPTVQSLLCSVDKLTMRKRFRSYDTKITPRFKVVKDATKKTIREAIERVGLPAIIKPSGLAQSLLVSICYHEEELQKNLRLVFRKMNKLLKSYKDETHTPSVLVEEFMEGDMYSIDGYVNSRGKIYFCPMVSVQTGRSIGFDDFFGYRQITPTLLKPKSIKSAEEIATKAVHAVGLRSSSVHIELMKTEAGWKIIELGPRLGGFRDTLYRLSYNIDHTENDILIRLPKIPKIPRKLLGHTAAMKFFAKKEGIITAISGIKRSQELASFHHISVNKKIGDRATFAKNGGKSVFNIILYNRDRSKLLADIRRLEVMVKIKTV